MATNDAAVDSAPSIDGAPDTKSAADPSIANPANTAASATAKKAPPYPLRNHALPVTDLPAHPALGNNASAPSMESFLHALLTPALQLIDSTIPKNWSGSTRKKSKPSKAEVKLYRWEDNRADQTWSIRRSTHANVPDPGTFTWKELDEALRVDHSAKEAEYTPDIYHHFEVCRWGPSEGLVESAEGFTDIDMRIVEMAHKLPSPLLPRAFAELVVSAQTSDGGLIVVQTPVDLGKLPAAMYSNGRNKTDGTDMQRRKGCLVAKYVSIERARTTEKGVIEWTMGTASDAGGALPLWLQRSQIGGAIAKDVGLVTKWIMSKRSAK